MTTLKWTPDLDTGIAEIDSQHRRIVGFINDLQVATQKKDRALVGEVVGEMVDYTMSHFAFEEALFEEAGYRFSGPHKKIHELFCRRVGEFQARFQGGEDVAEELHGLLSRWLFNHIRSEDHAYVEAINAHLKKKAAATPEDVKEQIKQELIRELRLQDEKKGWMRRLFG